MSETIAVQSVLNGHALGVGTWAWGDRMVWGFGRGYNESDLRQAFEASLAAGIRFFDTAEVYGQGKSEQLLGEFIQSADQKIIVATKYMPYPWRLSRRSLLRALRGSLARLGLIQVDLYQIHLPLPPINVETWMAAMSEAVQAGLTRAVGVSNFDQSRMQRAFDALAREGIQLVSNQVEYSLVNRKVEKNGLLKQCNELGVKLIAYSPLGMGLLTGKYTVENPPQGIRAGVYNYNRRIIEQTEPLLAMMKRIGAENAGKTPAQVALNWVICKGALPIPGAKNFTQAEQNAGAMDWLMTDDEIAALDEVSDRIAEE